MTIRIFAATGLKLFMTLVMALFMAASPAVADEPAGPNVYIYRDLTPPTAAGAPVFINGVRVVTLPNRHYTRLTLPEGEYVVALKWPFWAADTPQETTLTIRDKTDVHYLEITGSFTEGEYIVTETGGYIAGASHETAITEVSPSEGEAELRDCCKYKAPRMTLWRP